MLAVIKFVVILIAIVFITCFGIVYEQFRAEGDKENSDKIGTWILFFWIAIPLIATLWRV